MKATVYGVGVGPGDPELMTLKAARLIRETDVIAVPGSDPKESVAYRIAVQAVPDLAEKELVAIDLPMVKDRARLAAGHRKGAERIERFLDAGRPVVFLTLGDPTVYCTFSYLQHLLEEDGYPVELVSGIPSFCAAAARLGLPLAEWDEPLHIVPAVHTASGRLEGRGTYILMKSASRMPEIKRLLRESGRAACAVENCGMPDERVYRSAEEIPDNAGYFSLIIAKEDR